MQERKNGVKRLLRAIQDHATDANIKTLAKLLDYHEPQLREDIEAIRLVKVLNKDEKIDT